MVWENGISYDGMWRNGCYHGEGAKVYTDGGGYSGEWQEGLRHGKGTALYGGKWGYDRWQGPFVADKAHGEGVMHMADGRSIAFAFEDGEQAGAQT